MPIIGYDDEDTTSVNDEDMSSVNDGAMFDDVENPRHYAGDGVVDCKRALESMLGGYDNDSGAQWPYAAAYWIGCALKYIWRAPLKNGREDLEKAIECLKQAVSCIG